MTEKGNNLEAQLDIYSKLYKDLSAGGEVIYDDKAKSLILSKYGLLWDVTENFSAALEYSKVGDKESVDASFFHQANPNSSVGSVFSYDTTTHKVGVTSSLSHIVDENVSLKSRINNLGDLDASIKSKLSQNLTAEYHAGFNLSGIFHGKTHNEAYSGINLAFTF
jgi:Eukaryotic porin